MIWNEIKNRVTLKANKSKFEKSTSLKQQIILEDKIRNFHLLFIII